MHSSAGSRIADLQLVVYGWSLQPDLHVGPHLVADRRGHRSAAVPNREQPFWRDREASGRTYHIYFLNDRAGIYALGYPAPTPLQHATRLAEAAAVLVGSVLALPRGVTVLRAVRAQPASAPRAALPRNPRQLLSQAVPVLCRSRPSVRCSSSRIAFGAYMTTSCAPTWSPKPAASRSWRAASSTSCRAAQAPARQSRLRPDRRRDGLDPAGRRSGRQPLSKAPQLPATSQRDLFNSGLLPTRTPASVYRQVALDRRAGLCHGRPHRHIPLPGRGRAGPGRSAARRCSPCRSRRASARSSARSTNSPAACSRARCPRALRCRARRVRRGARVRSRGAADARDAADRRRPIRRAARGRHRRRTRPARRGLQHA